MSPVKTGPLAAVASWLLLTLGCSGPDVVLATLPAEEEAATPQRCATTQGDASDPVSDCPAGTYCEMPTCGSASGTCQLLPAICDNNEQPTCGCDGVTYFNDCLRQANGIASSTPMPCSFDSAYLCGFSGQMCPEGAMCAKLVRGGQGQCTANSPGICWVLPLQCPQPGPYDLRWDSCVSGGPCVDTCTAIATGGVYQHTIACP